MYDLRKWAFVIDAPFKVSDRCCDVLKKNPANRFVRESGRYPIIGTMACESQARRRNGSVMGAMPLTTKNLSAAL